MTHLGKKQKAALRKFARTFPEQIPLNGLTISFKWGKESSRGRVYVKLVLLQDGSIRRVGACKIYQPTLTKNLDLSFIPTRIWDEVSKDEIKQKIEKLKAQIE